VSGHFIEKCKWCGVVISQCRCADPNKSVILSVCKECQSHPVVPVHPQQVPVEPIKLELTEYGRGWAEGFAAGRSYQAGKDSRALNKCSSCKECEFILIPHAALDEAGKEE
jgi:hypothetical protein